MDVGSKGIKLVLDGGDVDGDGDVDVGHFSGDGADGVKDNVVIGGGGGRELYCRMARRVRNVTVAIKVLGVRNKVNCVLIT